MIRTFARKVAGASPGVGARWWAADGLDMAGDLGMQRTPSNHTNALRLGASKRATCWRWAWRL